MNTELAFFRTRLAFFGLFVVFLTCGIFIGQAQAEKSTPTFVEKASVSGQFEIESSRLALQNSQNPNVKQFAQEMIDDHTAAAQQLTTAIASSGTDISEPSPGLDKEHQKMLDKLTNLQGKDFDKLYVKYQKAGHKDAVALFKDYSKNGDNAALKGYATDTLPTLQQHKKNIDQLSASL